ncbi:protein of unknown function [Tepidanaerobacter acetatoxydans Re1]|uniref:Uncharacterized protein n=1 Tax=Tepidanaerobacter acetatoxydans (strain DSM 21804 / JCM 16047 / Re1) TaxID=1209989 RepID=L0RXR5_TEPAE|nr:protein of unknown function [Tepidanaerobacter acetatoxydans Re1]
MWEYVKRNGSQSFKLTFDEIRNCHNSKNPCFSYIQIGCSSELLIEDIKK